jgi:hypothetical protein
MMIRKIISDILSPSSNDGHLSKRYTKTRQCRDFVVELVFGVRLRDESWHRVISGRHGASSMSESFGEWPGGGGPVEPGGDFSGSSGLTTMVIKLDGSCSKRQLTSAPSRKLTS